MADITTEQVVDYLSNLPVIQIAELVKTLEAKWGVSAAPVAVAGVSGGGAATGYQAAEGNRDAAVPGGRKDGHPPFPRGPRDSRRSRGADRG